MLEAEDDQLYWANCHGSPFGPCGRGRTLSLSVRSRSGSASKKRGLLGGELLVGEHALLVQLAELLQAGHRVGVEACARGGLVRGLGLGLVVGGLLAAAGMLA